MSFFRSAQRGRWVPHTVSVTYVYKLQELKFNRVTLPGSLGTSKLKAKLSLPSEGQIVAAVNALWGRSGTCVFECICVCVQGQGWRWPGKHVCLSSAIPTEACDSPPLLY